MPLRFFKMLGSDEARAWYGPDHVELAAGRGAVGTLLISDELFRQVKHYPYDTSNKLVFAEPMILFSGNGTLPS
jgi:stalled ribosome rescue protein Dom34